MASKREQVIDLYLKGVEEKEIMQQCVVGKRYLHSILSQYHKRGSEFLQCKAGRRQGSGNKSLDGVADNVAAVVIKYKVSRAYIAAYLGISPAAISLWSRGKKKQPLWFQRAIENIKNHGF